MKTLLRYTGLLLLFALLCTGCIYSNNMIDGTVSAKSAWFIFLCGLLVLHISADRVITKVPLGFNWIDGAVLIFLIYCIINTSLHDGQFLSKKNIESSGLVTTYFFFKRRFCDKQFPTQNYTYLVFPIIFLQILVALLQWIEVMPSYNSNYKFSGFFFNPAPFVIFLSSLLIYCFAAFFFSVNRFVKYSGIILFILGLPVIIITLSRSAGIGLLAGIATVLVIRFQLIQKAKVVLQKTNLKITSAILFIVILISAAYFLYHLKKDSADGRILVWKIVTNIIQDHFFTGIGQGKFSAVFLRYQSHYFQLHPDRMKIEGKLADTVAYAFNDMLQLTVEQGIVGMVIFGIILALFVKFALSTICVLKSNEQFIVIGAIASVVIIIISGLFSYPMVMLPMQIVFYSSLAILSEQHYFLSSEIKKFTSGYLMRAGDWFGAAVSPLIGLWFIFYSISMYRGYAEGKYIEVNGYGYKGLDKLNKFQFILNGLPWYELRKCDYLLHIGKYEQAIIQLEQLKDISSDRKIFITLGNLYAYKKVHKKAEAQYLFLYYALPNLLKPKYLLAKLYHQTGQISNWEKVSQEILDFKVKVNSPEADVMILEIRDLKLEDSKKVH